MKFKNILNISYSKKEDAGHDYNHIRSKPKLQHYPIFSIWCLGLMIFWALTGFSSSTSLALSSTVHTACLINVTCLISSCQLHLWCAWWWPAGDAILVSSGAQLLCADQLDSWAKETVTLKWNFFSFVLRGQLRLVRWRWEHETSITEM